MEENNLDQTQVQVQKYKFPCGTVRDLIPLYRDNVCGEDSRKIVEEHIAECRDCAEFLESFSDPALDDIEEKLSAETTVVLEKHHKKERGTAITAGLITAGILIVPLISCLIINVASGNGLGWFYIVLTSLMTAASLTAVPIISREHKLAKTIGAFTISVIWLLMSCCLYTNGTWFFIAAVPVVFGMSLIFAPVVIRDIPLPDCLKNRKTLTVVLWDVFWLFLMLWIISLRTEGEWFLIAAISIILGLSIILMPILIKQIPLPEFLKNHKALLVMVWDTVWLYTLLFYCSRYVDRYTSSVSDYLFNCIWITAVCLFVPWTMFILIRYTKLHPLTKTGLCILIPGFFGAAADDIITLISRSHTWNSSHSFFEELFNVLFHKAYITADFIVLSIIFSSIAAAGVLFIAGGVIATLAKRKK